MVATLKTVLLVEDQPDQQIFLTNLLAANGYRTISATDNEEGLRIAGQENPDVIIIDMMMPTEQGLKLYRLLKSSDRLNSCPVIMLSSIDRRMFFQCHQIQKPHAAKGLPVPEAYIETPPEAEELLRLVDTLTCGPAEQKPEPSTL